MGEEQPSIPVRPVNRYEQYLYAILVELRNLNKRLGADQDSGELSPDGEVMLRERKR